MLEHILYELTTSSKSKHLADVDVNVETGVYYQSEYELFEEAKKFNCNAIVNCTGMGASELCGDSQLIRARGVILKYDRKTCKRVVPKEEDQYYDITQRHDACIFVDKPPWGTSENPSYMIVRGDDIVIGGTCLKGDTEPTVRPQERKRLLETARLLGIDTDACHPKEEWVGFRPYRQEIRCEIDTKYSDNNVKNGYDAIRLVHCYGTGGSGWTVYGCLAKEATRLVLQ